MRTKNMHGFNSLRAVYFFEKGDKADAKASDIENSTNGDVNDEVCGLRQYAAFMRSEADMAEDDYLARKASLKIKK